MTLPRAARRRHRLRARSTGRLLATTALLAGATTIGCRDAATSFGPAPAAAESNARDAFAAMAMRFTNVQRAPKFAQARGKLGRYALTPSKIFDDSSIWLPTAAGADASTRTLTLQGSFADNHYLFTQRADAPLPSRLGESRHAMRLRRIDDGEYEWATTVDQAIGTTVRAADLEAVYSALVGSAVRLGAADRGSDAAIRADYRAAFPRTTTALGHLFSLDGVRTTAGRDGASGVLVTIGLHPEGLHGRYPAFERYVRKYVAPSRYRFTVRDRRGARWMEATAKDDVLTVQLRALPDGRMVPIDGAARPMPDSLTLTGEFFTHILVFDVGVSDLVADVTVLRAPHERGWSLRFAKEPDWHLPLATRYLIRAPLRRPFARGGVTFRLAARDSAGAQTLLDRRLTMAVQESAILRFLGSLGFTAMSDFAGKSEADENRFVADVFNAMRADAANVADAGHPPAAAAEASEPR